jgi:hypothetical protein
MLKFHPEQPETFAQLSCDERIGRLLSDLTMDISGQVVAGSGSFSEEILEQLKRARQNGFTTERECARWVLAAWCLGDDFDRKIASIRELLNRQDVGPGYKALALELMVRAFFVSMAGHPRRMM